MQEWQGAGDEPGAAENEGDAENDASMEGVNRPGIWQEVLAGEVMEGSVVLEDTFVRAKGILNEIPVGKAAAKPKQPAKAKAAHNMGTTGLSSGTTENDASMEGVPGRPPPEAGYACRRQGSSSRVRREE